VILVGAGGAAETEVDPSPGGARPASPNCSAITSGEWLGSMTPPNPSRIDSVLAAMWGRSARRSPRRRSSRWLWCLGVPDAPVAGPALRRPPASSTLPAKLSATVSSRADRGRGRGSRSGRTFNRFDISADGHRRPRRRPPTEQFSRTGGLSAPCRRVCLLGAVVHLVFGEEDGLDRRPAARAGLAPSPLVDLERQSAPCRGPRTDRPPRNGRSRRRGTCSDALQAAPTLLRVEFRFLS